MPGIAQANLRVTLSLLQLRTVVGPSSALTAKFQLLLFIFHIYFHCAVTQTLVLPKDTPKMGKVYNSFLLVAVPAYAGLKNSQN